jgi:hypothetical protein
LMDEAYHFLDPVTGLSNDKVLPAPQANMIAKMAKGLMADPASQPWLLYALGGIAAIMLLMAGVPMLAFALGMYLPIYINMAVLAGAICAWIIARTGKTAEEKKARGEQVNLVAAGLMAGAAIVGLMIAVLRLTGIGAPIQYISVGVDYRIEAVVEGKPVVLDGKPANWCKDLDPESRKKCGEILAKKKHETDENGQDVLDADGEPVLRHAWYEKSIGRGIGLFMLLGLCFACYWLSKLGARWQRSTAPPDREKEEGT